MARVSAPSVQYLSRICSSCSTLDLHWSHVCCMSLQHLTKNPFLFTTQDFFHGRQSDRRPTRSLSQSACQSAERVRGRSPAPCAAPPAVKLPSDAFRLDDAASKRGTLVPFTAMEMRVRSSFRRHHSDHTHVVRRLSHQQRRKRCSVARASRNVLRNTH